MLWSKENTMVNVSKIDINSNQKQFREKRWKDNKNSDLRSEITIEVKRLINCAQKSHIEK